MASLKKDLIRVYEELHKDFANYINCNKLRKKLKLNYRTVKEYVKILQILDLFKKPICEWHDEAILSLGDSNNKNLSK